MPFISVATRHHVATAHGFATAHSDVDQSLLIVLGFLTLLTLGLVLAARLEPGNQAHPLVRQPGGAEAQRPDRRR